jgi:uncharacterized membrane protein YkvA (DUF1232 family)
MRELLLALPNFVKLMVRLMRDPQVAKSDKVVLSATILYVVAPLDFLPDLVPFLGQIDDTYLVALATLRLLYRTDERIVLRHWDGEVNLKHLATRIVDVASVFLPARIRDALTARVVTRDPRRIAATDAAPAGG